MKKESDPPVRGEPDFSAGVRGKYAARYREGPAATRHSPVAVFLAHSWRDRFAVRDLADRLERHGVRVWLDEAELRTGDSLSEKLSAAVSEVEYFAAVLSRSSASSAWLSRELRPVAEDVLRPNHVPILTVLLEPVEIPDFLQGGFSVDLTTPERSEASFPRLLRAIGAVEDAADAPRALHGAA